MFRDYFDYNGKRYYTGTVLLVQHQPKKKAEVTFVCYSEKLDQYVYKYGDCNYFLNENNFKSKIICVTDKVNNRVHAPVVKTKDIREISGMHIGCLWYVFLMGISVIFNEAIGLWIFITIMFIMWVKRKVKEEGNYIEW